MPRAAKTPRSSAKTGPASTTANIGFEAKLWLAADKLRNNMDDAMVALERDNPRLKGVLPKDYACPGLDTARRGGALSPCEATRPGLKGNRGDIRNVGLAKWPLRQRPFGLINPALCGIEAGLAVECAETVRRL